MYTYNVYNYSYELFNKRLTNVLGLYHVNKCVKELVI